MYRVNEAGSSLIESCRKIATNGVASAAIDVDTQAQFPEAAIRSLADAGLLGLTLPVEVGGKGQSPSAFAAVVEELAQSCASTAMIYVMHIASTQAIAASSTFGNRDALLADIAAGQHLTTLAFSERGSRSQFWAPVSKMEESADGGYVTSAQKSWVTSASYADSYVSSAQMPGAASPLESVLYLVDRKAEGVQIEGGFDGLGLRGNDSSPVTLDNVNVPADRLLTELGAGAGMMLEVVLPWFSVGTAAMANGLCRAAVTATAGHLAAGRFEHQDSALRDLPTLRARLAEMSLQTEQSRALLAHTAAAMEQPDEQTPLFVLQSRLAAIQAATDVTDLAMKACGGAAFSKQLGIERLFRDARAGWVMAPTADHLKEFVGRALTGLPLF
jgi:alkylation response protein AidB-like acyl-CoA dehydrogenase